MPVIKLFGKPDQETVAMDQRVACRRCLWAAARVRLAYLATLDKDGNVLHRV